MKRLLVWLAVLGIALAPTLAHADPLSLAIVGSVITSIGAPAGTVAGVVGAIVTAAACIGRRKELRK